MPLAAGLVGLIALLLRVPALFSQPPLTFDEGVYGASVLAMRSGGRPFHDVFSSQGPLFLPILRLADIIGLQAHWAPRLASVGAGILIALCSYFIAARYTSPPRAFGVGMLVAVSGSVLEAAGPLQSEGPALALALLALWIVLADDDPAVWRPWLAGALAGAAVAVKSVFIFPVLAAAAVPYLRRRRYAALVAAAGTSAIVLTASILPWGWNEVYRQSVAFQRTVPRAESMRTNLVSLIEGFARYDQILLITALIAAAAWARARWRGRGIARSAGPLLSPLLIWVAGSLVLLIGFLGPGVGYRRYTAVIIVPVALLVGISRLRTPLLLALALLALPVQLVTQPETRFPQITDAERAALAFMAELPPGAQVVTDEPGLTWWADRQVPPDLNDTSSARVEAGSLTETAVISGLLAPQTCAYIPWSNRFADLFSIDPVAYDYALVEDLGQGKLLYRRNSCEPG